MMNLSVPYADTNQWVNEWLRISFHLSSSDILLDNKNMSQQVSGCYFTVHWNGPNVDVIDEVFIILNQRRILYLEKAIH